MKTYLYPRNLTASASVWLWRLQDFLILTVAGMISLFMVMNLRSLLPAALTLCYGFLTIRIDESTILDNIRYASRFLIATVQYYEWR